MGKMCEWVYGDPERVLNVYASDDHDPDIYFIWLERHTRTVRRKPGESGGELWERALQEIEDMRRSLARVGRGELCPIAQVFVGGRPTEAQEKALMFHYLAHAFWRESNWTGPGSSSRARVQALSELRKLLKLFPGVPWADDVRRQIKEGNGPRAPALRPIPIQPWAGKGRAH